MRVSKLGATATLAAAVCLTAAPAHPQEPKSEKRLVIERAARPWEFLCAAGKRAGIFGNEAGRAEVWTYPLKIFRDFHLTFLTEGRAIPAEALVRSVEVRPESTTLIYSGDTFRVRETFFVPVDEAGAVIEFEVETEQPLEIEAAFHRDFQLEWPAAIGGSYINWDAKLRAFAFGEETKKFAAYAGSPTANAPMLEYQTNYSAAGENSLRLGVTAKGSETKILAVAGSVQGAAQAEKTYEQLVSGYKEMQRASALYYEDYLRRTVSVEFPDKELEQAYDWAKISLAQGLVTNPGMGTGLVAGYRTSGESQRPGFAWYFGRDTFWSSLALNSDGDFATAKTALEFVANFQREDGKLPHEIAQSAGYVNWFKDYPYSYASADSTPLYIIAMNDYVISSGDVEFARSNWDKLWKAYEFLRSTYGANGLPRNFGVGHGWVEGGPLLPVETELYQSGLATESLRALANLAKLTGKDEESAALSAQFEKEEPRLDAEFWSPEKGIYAFALDRQGKRVDEASVLSTVPMWFGLLDGQRAEQMISVLAGREHQSDWGMRIIAKNDPNYSGGGYHFGSVWPLFTGWASVSEYRYHRANPGYENLRANALLALDGSPGHVTEVLSGDYYEPLSTSSPHQIWSAAMVISPILRGMLGLSMDATRHSLTLAPHLPAGWNSAGLRQVPCGAGAVDLAMERDPDTISLRVQKTDREECGVTFKPAISLRAVVRRVELNGRALPFHVEVNGPDQHVVTNYKVGNGSSVLVVRLRNDFGAGYKAELPALGSAGNGLRIVDETWNEGRDQLMLNLEGSSGKTYELELWNAREIGLADGGELVEEGHGAKLRVKMPEGEPNVAVKKTIVLHFAPRRSSSREKRN